MTRYIYSKGHVLTENEKLEKHFRPEVRGNFILIGGDEIWEREVQNGVSYSLLGSLYDLSFDDYLERHETGALTNQYYIPESKVTYPAGCSIMKLIDFFESFFSVGRNCRPHRLN